MEKFKINDDIIQLLLLYSKITIAMNAARVMKTLGNVDGILGREINRTEEYIIRFAANTLMSYSAVVFDRERSALNIRKLLTELKPLAQHERSESLKAVDRLYQKHKNTIDYIKYYRDNLTGHTNKGINSINRFMEIPEHDVADIQRYLTDVADLIEELSVFPGNNTVKRYRVLDYDDIRNDLKA